MSQIHRLLRENVLLLERGRELIAGLAPELYGAPAERLALSGVGSHLRHCLDVYDAFLRGLESGAVDYDGRARDPRVETDAAHAAARIAATVAELERLDPERAPQALRVKPEATEGLEPARWSTSSLARELQFLCSHTVHHYALIATVVRYHGGAPDPAFGVAPSTLRYWDEREREADACAP